MRQTVAPQRGAWIIEAKWGRVKQGGKSKWARVKQGVSLSGGG